MATEDRKEVLSQNQIETPVVEIVQPAIEKLIYVIPVSYTHLDVYKRQIQSYLKIC